MGFVEFFKDIANDLHKSVYLALGGSIEDQTYDWANRGVHFASILIKIFVLLLFIGLIYWILVYLIKHAKGVLHLSPKQVKVGRSVLRYIWLMTSILAIMTQVGVSAMTVRAVAKAGTWIGVYYVMWAMSGQLVRHFTKSYEMNESIEQLFDNLIVVMILVLASGTILAQFGFDIVSLVAGLGIMGFALGFAAQSTIANFIAGIAILVEQSFQVGDWIRVGSQEGKVAKITLRTTQILTRDNLLVILPNSTVAGAEIVNLTSKMFSRFDILVRVSLDADVRQVRSLVLTVLKADEAVLAHPLSTVTVSHIGEYGIHLIARFWVAPSNVARLPIIKEKMTEKIKTTLDNAGYLTPYPHMHLITDSENKNTKTLVLPK